MAVTSTDLLMIERSGTLYKAPVSELPSGGGGGGAAGLTLLQQETITTNVAAIDFDLPSGYSRFRFIGHGISTGASTRQIRMNLSVDGGSTFITTGDHKVLIESPLYGSTTETRSNSSAVGFFLLQNTGLSIDNVGISFTVDISSDAEFFTALGFGSMPSAAGTILLRRDMTAKADLLRLTQNADSFTAGTLSLYGYKESV